LRELLLKYDISIDAFQEKQFQQYMDILLEYNQKFNLTSITEPNEIVIKHFCDSLLLLKNPDWQGVDKVVDLGTGAGFPGIPLKIICPQIELLLVDASAKKVAFLNEVIELLKLSNAQARQMRAEEAGQNPQYRQKYDWVVTRALAPMPVLAEYCLPLIKIGGTLAAYKGPGWQAELTSASEAIKLLGGRYQKTLEGELPEQQGQRAIVMIEKNRETPSKYPRRPGLPAKQPL
jgi:16S rRNA (guanine527-N7)-methyltransferase